MNRRDLFALRTTSPGTAEVSCETLFVHYCDALGAGEGDAFLSRAAAEFAKTRRLILKNSYWLDQRRIAEAIAPVLTEYRARGGLVDFA
jgi:hypothetical protein